MSVGHGRLSLSLLAVLLMAGLNLQASAQTAELGKVDFPTTGPEAAKSHFLRGVAALHSFWYEEALDAFRESTKADHGFMMGYWGEAMAHNHPLWSQQETEAARKALQKIGDTSKLTPRERAYIEAVKALYGEGDKLARDKAYAAAMEKLYRDYSDDLEAAAFYSLSLLGVVRPGEKGFSRQMKAGAIALTVYEKNPNHPGAAHYIIHAFDDPEHAILALPAARRYAEIAPAAHHARHMPSHIFLQLGMWPEAAASNESAWAASDQWVKRKGLPIARRDYHSLSWLLYVYTQQGRYKKAEELLALMRGAIKEAGDRRMRGSYTEMAAAYAVETERWDSLSLFLQDEGMKAGAEQAGTGAAGQHCAHKAMPADAKAAAKTTLPAAPSYAGAPRNPRLLFARGLAAAAQKQFAEAEARAIDLAALRKLNTEEGDSYAARQVEIMELGVRAQALSLQGDHEEAITVMKRATALEEELSPPSGPPDLVKPSHELFGELLLRANRPKEAQAQFAVALARQPNRARSLVGAARAAALSQDASAAAIGYSTIVRMWKDADPQLPELKEAQTRLGQGSTR